MSSHPLCNIKLYVYEGNEVAELIYLQLKLAEIPILNLKLNSKKLLYMTLMRKYEL